MAPIAERALLHKNHGWIVAPEGVFFTFSASGKMIHLAENPPADVLGSPFCSYPFGTAWRTSSILAYGD